MLFKKLQHNVFMWTIPVKFLVMGFIFRLRAHQAIQWVISNLN